MIPMTILGRQPRPVPPPTNAPEMAPAKKPTTIHPMKFISSTVRFSHGRELDLSRFDTGGVESGRTPQQLSAYLFSDRGIYRPGETVHLGVITRSADWEASLTGLPIDRITGGTYTGVAATWARNATEAVSFIVELGPTLSPDEAATHAAAVLDVATIVAVE